ncbi:hypothetical protein Rhopal_005711-T1 [Rhodotorula paludigena]|uniref:Zn(2)-C6 fungal-type domain-containing protein n=1 Tax=Rhodotorula paludigena TaxID=86838 RepID=A0AAV5GK25_9BASI|nr:hypothetical protein Rhopal_005711-T1 [Rhodotorula paludigena]
MAADIPIDDGPPARRSSTAAGGAGRGAQAAPPPRATSTSSSGTAGPSSSALPPVYGPDGKLLQGNALVNAHKGGIRIETSNGGERTSRACLACRRLKTRCDGAEEPPCKRCRAGNHDSSQKNEATLVDKFRQVEKSLSAVLDSIGSGEKPDPAALSQLQASLADGIGANGSESADDTGRRASSVARGTSLGFVDGMGDGKSPSPGSDGTQDLPASSRKVKRARHSSVATGPTYTTSPTLSNPLVISPLSVSTASYSGGVPGSAQIPHLALGVSPTQAATNLPLPSVRHVSVSPSNPSPIPGPPTSLPGLGSSLALLADASLAAQIDGRSQLTGLDPNFKLSTVTDALQRNKERLGAIECDAAGATPAVLSKGIVTPELAVELFTIFFDFAYIHLPLLDPARHTAPFVCATSPFLFTVILAVASRFHSDPTLHQKIYEEAHRCFVECVSNGERSVESVQACCILTVWTYPPTGESAAAGREERPKRAWLYFGMGIRMALELNLFRPTDFVDRHLSKPGNASKPNPWITLPKDGPEAVSEQDAWDALNRERTWLMVFVIDRNMSTVMGRPYQIQEAKPLLLPLHPQCLPFDLGVIAHVELQTIIGQVMDTFRDRLYGLSCAGDEMPSQVVMKLFNSRMDEWKARWCPMPGEPIANNLLFYFYASKLFLNTIPLHTMLRNGDASDDPDSVSSTISSARSLLELAHAYAELSVLRHCPDVNFLLMLYSTVFLVKVRVSNSRFAQLVNPDELEQQLLQLMKDCQEAAQGDTRHAAMTCYVIVRALGASWKALENGGGRSRGTSTRGDEDENPVHGGVHGATSMALGPFAAAGSTAQQFGDGAFDSTLSTEAGASSLPNVSLGGALPPSPALFAATSANPFSNPFAASSNAATPIAQYRSGGGGLSAVQTPSGFVGNSMFDGAPLGSSSAGIGGAGPAPAGLEDVDHFLSDANFFNSMLVGRGASGFFSWENVAGSLDMSPTALDPFSNSSTSDPFAFNSFSYNPQGGTGTAAHTPTAASASQADPLMEAGRKASDGEAKPVL